MTFQFVPLFAVLLINACLGGYMLFQGDRSRSGFFLVVNGIALILWAGGVALYRGTGESIPATLALPHLATLLVPANFAYYALMRMRIREGGKAHASSPIVFGIFAPPVVLTLLEHYDSNVAVLMNYTLNPNDLGFSRLSMRASIVYTVLCITGTLGLLASEYNSSTGPEKNTCKHLLGAMAGPLLFASFAWVAALAGSPSRVPTPSLVLAIMAQVGMLVVLRQEELRHRELLSRIVFLFISILVTFLIITLLLEFYSLALGAIVVVDQSTGAALLLGGVGAIALAWFLRADRLLDRMLFQRAAEYRQLVEDTRAELQSTRERLRRTERLSMVGELAARVAHEIKNPLGPIKGYTQLMREKLLENPDYPNRDSFLKHLAIISEEVENIDKRIRQLLDSARQPQLLMEPMSFNKLIERCAQLLELEVSTSSQLSPTKTNLSLRVLLDDSLPEIIGDADRLEEALFNLMRNALEAMEQSGTVLEISTRHAKSPEGIDGVIVEIKDDGPGLGVHNPEELFEAFTTSKEKGTGLGLSIVRAIFEAHGGWVRLENGAECGACALGWLPIKGQAMPGALLPKAEKAFPPA